jgi:putative sigma-54 modulation protein
MEIQITGTNIEIKPETQRFIESKFSKLSKHLPDIMDIKVEVSEEGTKSPLQRYMVRAAVNSGVGRNIFHTEERANDLNIATDHAVEVLSHQLEKHKGKLYDRGRGNPFVRGKFPRNETPAENIKTIVKTKHFIIEPMTTEEAIEEMERLNHDFFLFTDNDSSETRLIYRRKDGNYGVIIPEFKKVS